MLGTAQTCKQQPTVKANIHIEDIRWIRSHEEDQEEWRVYRPHDYPFPPSRSRSGFQLNGDGSALFGAIAPTDGINWVPAEWSLSPDSVLEIKVKIKGSGASSRYKYQLGSVDSGKLSLVLLKHDQWQDSN